MNGKRWASCLLMAMTAFTGCQEDTNVIVETDNTITERYYPIRPDTAEWEALTSHDAMVRATQLSEETIQSLSTEELLEACLHYPLLGDIRFFNSMQVGFDRVSSRFNGLQALMRRADVGSVTLRRYQAMNPEDLSSDWSLERQGDFAVQFHFVEVILAQDALLATLNQEELTELASSTLRLLEQKQNLAQVFGLTGQVSSALLAARTMRAARFAPFVQIMSHRTDLESFVEHGPMRPSMDVVQQTFDSARIFSEQIQN